MNFTASNIKAHNGIRVNRDTSFSDAIKITPPKAANAKQKLARPTDAQGPPAPKWQNRAGLLLFIAGIFVCIELTSNYVSISQYDLFNLLRLV